jgi:hypothetical protein
MGRLMAIMDAPSRPGLAWSKGGQRREEGPVAKENGSKQDQAQQNAPASRELMIAEAAYMLAELRQFEPGHELEDWLAAEKMIDAGLYPTRKK